MSYGAVRERKAKLKKLEQITDQNVKDFLRLAGEQYASDYVKIVNDRASERETPIDSKFLGAVAIKDIENAFKTFKNDTENKTIGIIKSIIGKQTGIDYNSGISNSAKTYLNSSEGLSDFFNAAKIGIRKILQSPLQMGLSRTVLQKYLQA
jgi:hypothetical protein